MFFNIDYKYRVSICHNFLQKLIRQVGDKSVLVGLSIILIVAASFCYKSGPYRDKIGTPVKAFAKTSLRRQEVLFEP